jgi:N-acetylglucosaminyl-diphospho-decaprenol L-rhamnosyltransferase
MLLSTQQTPQLAPPVRVTAPAPDVSVCIVNWNCREMLRDCLDSLVRHEQGATAEVIVVDNASTDGAAEMVAHDFPEVVLVRNRENAGFSRANNQAVRLARGRYLFFLNNDTLVPPETLGQLFEEAQRRPEAGILAPRLRDALGGVQCSCRGFPTVAALLHRNCLFRWTGIFRQAYRRYRGRGGNLDTACTIDVALGAALFLSRELFRAHGGWDECYTFGGEDIDLCARIGKTRPVVYYPEVEVIHYGRVSSRERPGYTHSKTVLGITRFLRKSGTSSSALLIYKLAVTIDAPLRWLGEATRYIWRKARGRHRSASRSLQGVRGLGHFLRHDLVEFWRV